MRKTFVIGAAAMALLSMAACSGKKDCDKKCGTKGGERIEIFTGVLPGADCDGVRYTLNLEYDHGDKDGDYDLTETYLQADSVSPGGFKDLRSFNSEGDFVVEHQGGKTYLKLIKDQKDSGAGSVETPLYFLVDSDSTLTLTDARLQVSQTEGLNYTLRRTK